MDAKEVKNEVAKEVKKSWFCYSGEQGYYGRLCENYGVKCDVCTWQDAYRCRDGWFRG